MEAAKVTIDTLVASVQSSYIEANKLILESCRNTETAAKFAALSGESQEWPEQFIINKGNGTPPVEIPLDLFHSKRCYYLSDLRLELPCFTVVHPRLFGKKGSAHLLFPAYRPTFWQRLFYVCHVYRLTIEVGAGKIETRFVVPTQQEYRRLLRAKIGTPSPSITWKFELTEKQVEQLHSLPATVVRPIYWRHIFAAAWHWLRNIFSRR